MERIIGSRTISLKKFFFCCFAGSLLFHLIAAWFSIGFQYTDEQYQIMEFAGYKLGLIRADRLPWEFGYEMRQAIQPYAVIIVYRFLGIFKVADPFLCSLVLRVFSAALGWFSLLLLTRECLTFIESQFWKKFAIALACFIWFMPYVQAHFSAESISGSLFFLAAALILRFKRTSAIQPNLYFLFAAGTALGLAFVVRYQTAFLIFGLGLWCIFQGRLSFKNILLLVIPALVMVGFGLFLDYLYYGHWVSTAYNYYYANIVLNKLSGFGLTPFYFYFYIYYLNLFPPFSIFIMGTIVYAWIKYPKNILTWICLPFFLIHSFIGHKEIRFLFPIIEAIPFLLVLPFQKIGPGFYNKWFAKWPVGIMWGLNILLLSYFCLKPANAAFGLYDYIYKYDLKHPKAKFITNVQSPYNVNGSVVYINRPDDIKICPRHDVNGMINEVLISDTKNTIVIINNTQTADSFRNAFPSAGLVYKSLPEAFNYFTWNKKEELNKVWYVFDISSSISSCRMIPAKRE